MIRTPRCAGRGPSSDSVFSVNTSRPRRAVPFWWNTKAARAVASRPLRSTTTSSSVSDISVAWAKPRACAA